MAISLEEEEKSGFYLFEIIWKFLFKSKESFSYSNTFFLFKSTDPLFIFRLIYS